VLHAVFANIFTFNLSDDFEEIFNAIDNLQSSNHTSGIPMTDARIQKLLNDIQLVSPDRHEIVQDLRKLILGLTTGISEEVKYGGILFGAEHHFCGIFAYTNHVSVEFGNGASLPDKFNVLEGSGKLRRHIKVLSKQDIKGKHVEHYLRLALAASKNA
jgi:hypothetical protein